MGWRHGETGKKRSEEITMGDLGGWSVRAGVGRRKWLRESWVGSGAMGRVHL